tara:strand:- start:344 stop:1198 length:855 start_codon:yes stop_codon:yes gene_type:complete
MCERIYRAVASLQYKKGDIITIKNLANFTDLNGELADLNGELACVQGYDNEEEKYKILVKNAKILIKSDNIQLAVEIKESQVCSSNGLYVTADVKAGQCILVEEIYAAPDIHPDVSQAWSLVEKWLTEKPPTFHEELAGNETFANKYLNELKNKEDKDLLDKLSEKYGKETKLIFNKCITNFFRSPVSNQSFLSRYATKMNHSKSQNVASSTITMNPGTVFKLDTSNAESGQAQLVTLHETHGPPQEMNVVFALTDIAEGEELLYDYGDEHVKLMCDQLRTVQK